MFRIRSGLLNFHWRYHIDVYTGDAEILDANSIALRPPQNYPYADVYDANGHSPYAVEDYTPVITESELTGENIIVNSRTFVASVSPLCS